MRTGILRAKIKRPVEKHRVAAQIDELAAEAAGAAGRTIAAAGLIIPGIYFAATGNVWAPNLFGHEEVPLARRAAARRSARHR